MIPEDIEVCAKRAYETFALMVNEAAGWDGLPTQHHWRDRVTAQLNKPDAEPANIQEACVKQAIDQAVEPVKVPEEVVEAVAEEATEEDASPKKKKGGR